VLTPCDLCVSTGAYQKACDALEPLVKRAPEFQQGHVLLAMAYIRLGRTEDAERERAIARKLGAERQMREEGARPTQPRGASREETPAAPPPRRGEDDR
jgi:predicted Zn-dependent protease